MPAMSLRDGTAISSLSGWRPDRRCEQVSLQGRRLSQLGFCHWSQGGACARPKCVCVGGGDASHERQKYPESSVCHNVQGRKGGGGICFQVK